MRAQSRALVIGVLDQFCNVAETGKDIPEP